MSTAVEQTNGHSHSQGEGEVDLNLDYTSGSGRDAGVGSSKEPTQPVFFRLAAREQFVQAARRAKMTLKDAADLAAELLDRVTQDERPETPAERKARLAAKAGGQS